MKASGHINRQPIKLDFTGFTRIINHDSSIKHGNHDRWLQSQGHLDPKQASNANPTRKWTHPGAQINTQPAKLHPSLIVPSIVARLQLEIQPLDGGRRKSRTRLSLKQGKSDSRKRILVETCQTVLGLTLHSTSAERVPLAGCINQLFFSF